MAENEGGEGQAGGEGVAGAVGVASEGQGQGGGQGHEQSVPYARFQESRLELQELKGKYGQMQSVLDQMKGALSPEQKKGFKLDYSNPDGSIDKWGNQLVDEKLSALRKEMAEKEYTRQNSEAINWFRNQEGYAPDLEEKAAQFTIENKGNKPLQLFKVSSSCGCTVGIITIDGNISPEFGMHNNSNWSGEILPGKTASLSVIYRPYIMPVKGPVTRDVFVTTNDPENKLLTFTVKADVE